MKKFTKLTTLLTLGVSVVSLTPVLSSCSRTYKIDKIEATIIHEYFVGEQIKKEDFAVTATYKDGSTKQVTDWTCDVNLPYTFEDSEKHTFTISYRGVQTKVIKQAQEHYDKITINFVSGGHGSVGKDKMIIQAPVKWSAVIKPSVTPDSGYEFDKWVDENNVEISKDKVLKTDCTVKALFKEQAVSEKGLKFTYQTLAGAKFFSVEWDGSDSINKNLVIPSTHRYEKDGQYYPVLWVRNFKNCPHIETVTIPSCVQEIGSEAFAFDLTGNESKLTTVTFASNSQCEKINSSAFKGCAKLAGIEIPKNITGIGPNAFDMTSNNDAAFTTLTFEADSKIASIEQDAFKNCKKLTTVSLPNKLTSLGGFNGTSITSITIPSTVNTVLKECFNESTLATVTFENDSKLTTIGESAFRSTKIATIDIPDTVNTIGGHAFRDCSSLATVILSDSSQLKNLGSSGGNVFNGTIIQSFTIPTSVTTLGSTLFGTNTNASALTSLTFKDFTHEWKVGFQEETPTFQPSGNPTTDAQEFLNRNNGAVMNKKTS